MLRPVLLAITFVSQISPIVKRALFYSRNVGVGFKVYMTRNFSDLLGIVYFIVVAFLVAELFKVLIYAN